MDCGKWMDVEYLVFIFALVLKKYRFSREKEHLGTLIVPSSSSLCSISCQRGKRTLTHAQRITVGYSSSSPLLYISCYYIELKRVLQPLSGSPFTVLHLGPCLIDRVSREKQHSSKITLQPLIGSPSNILHLRLLLSRSY